MFHWFHILNFMIKIIVLNQLRLFLDEMACFMFKYVLLVMPKY